MMTLMKSARRRFGALAVAAAMALVGPGVAAAAGDAQAFVSQADHFSVVVPSALGQTALDDHSRSYVVTSGGRAYMINVMDFSASLEVDPVCEQVFIGMRQSGEKSGGSSVAATQDATLAGRHARGAQIAVNGEPGVARCTLGAGRLYFVVYLSSAGDEAEGARFFDSFRLLP